MSSNSSSLDPSLLIAFEEGDFHFVDDESRLPYTHLKYLANGGTAAVDKVKDETTQAVFARKIFMIPSARRGKRESERTFRNEIGIIRSLGRHHHVVHVFAAYETDRHFCILLQPAANQGDLSWFLTKYVALSNEAGSSGNNNTRLQLMRQVLEQSFGCLASGLAFMHQQRIRHKDIKPRNILVHEGSVLYTDFGYSRDSSEHSHSMTFGKPNSVTPKYAAPEVQDHDERNSLTDVYSLGCVFLELFSALTEFSSLLPKERETYSSTLESVHANLKKIDVPGRLSFLPNLITSMTAWNRTDRPRASEILEEIISQPGFCCNKCRSPQGVIESTGRTDAALLDTDMARLDLSKVTHAQSQNEQANESHQAREMSARDINLALVLIACRKLTPRDRRGYIYIAVDLARQDCVRIGSTDNMQRHIETYDRACERKLHYMRSYHVESCRRLEELVMADLQHLREPRNCPQCRLQHSEWFKVEPAEADRIVASWVHWLETTKPYDQDKKLQPFWRDRILYGNQHTRNFGDYDHDARRRHWRDVLSSEVKVNE